MQSKTFILPVFHRTRPNGATTDIKTLERLFNGRDSSQLARIKHIQNGNTTKKNKRGLLTDDPFPGRLEAGCTDPKIT
jgi:hypothetical protein